jgi:hypothetical protein
MIPRVSRWLVIVVAVICVLFGLLGMVSALTRGLGITNGFLVGLALFIAGTIRLVIEARRGKSGEFR